MPDPQAPDPQALAATHARAFAGGSLRAWSAAEFAALLAAPHVFLTGDAGSFALGRAVAGEAELLTLATDPDYRRAGLAQAALAAYHAEAIRRGATQAFLEVAEDNAPARALYVQAGYSETARRPGYFRAPDGRPVTALIMTRALPLRQPGPHAESS